jgi:hypothetical protein
LDWILQALFESTEGRVDTSFPKEMDPY